MRDALTHRVGVPQLPPDVKPEQLCDWEGMCAFLAAEPPAWPPGTRTGYHALTYGWLLGELVRRVDGRPIAAFVQEELCRPLGHPGAGGSIAFADPEHGLAVGFTRTLLTRAPDPAQGHTFHVMEQLRATLGVG